jgi:hypothetical protein
MDPQAGHAADGGIAGSSVVHLEQLERWASLAELALLDLDVLPSEDEVDVFGYVQDGM